MRPVLPIAFTFRFGAALFPVCLLVTLTGCGRLLFYPDKEWVRTPHELGIDYQEVVLTAADGVELSAWWLQPRSRMQGIVLFLHGNAENISTHLGSVYWLPEQGYGVLMLDYRGYGRSSGKPSLHGAFLDIEAALDWVLTRKESERVPVFLLGQSLGASMGGYVVATSPSRLSQLDGVVLDSGFTGYRDLAGDISARHWSTRVFAVPVIWSLPSGYDLVDHIDRISPTPVLIIHGTLDQVVPFEHGQRLFDAAGKPKSFLRYDGPHIGTFRDLRNRELLLKFFERVTAAGPEQAF
jgi:fermentation-respiration switch protein FrsA (DUF1100 family)